MQKVTSRNRSKQREIVEIPEDWESIPLKQTGTLNDGDWILEKDYADSGVRLLQVGDIGIGIFLDKSKKFISVERRKQLNCTLVKQGKDILISRMPDPIGRACLSPVLSSPYIVAVDITIFSVDDKRADHNFLIYALNNENNLRQVEKYISGTTRQRISRKNLEILTIGLPQLDEQKKIASILSKVDELIQKTDQVIEQTQRLKKGLIQRLLTKGIGDTRFKRVKSSFGTYEHIPEDWDIVEFVELMDDIRYGTSVKCVSEPHGVPVLRIPNIIHGVTDFSDMKYAVFSESDIERYTLRDGDIIFVRTNGNREYVGRCAIFHQDTSTYAFASYLIRVRLKLERLNPDFLGYQLTLPTLRKQIFDRARTSAGQYNINTVGLKSLRVIVPPLVLQNKILSIICVIDTKIRLERNQKSKLESLKEGLMQKLLTGKIRAKV